MKYKHLLLLFPLMITLPGCSRTFKPKELDPNAHYDDVYLIMGQSNATGVASPIFLEESNPDVFEQYSKGNEKVLTTFDTYSQINNEFVPTKFGFADTTDFFGPEIGIAEELSQKEETSYIIKATKSGSCLRTEYVDLNGGKKVLYKRFISFIKTQLKLLESKGCNPRVRGVFWMQGESDSFFDERAKYDKCEQYFFEYLRHDLNDYIYDHFNFVDAYIYTKGICWVQPEVINAAKDRFCERNDNCYCIKTNGEDESAITLEIKSNSGEDPDDLAHYDSSSMLLLGHTAGKLLQK